MVHAVAFILMLQGVAAVYAQFKLSYIDDRKTVWVIEDSPIDVIVYRSQIDKTKYKVRYFKSLNGLGFRMLFDTPDGAIADYQLPRTNGDEFFKVCRLNKIPVVMVTSFDTEIFGIEDKDIIKKSVGFSHFGLVKQWLENNLATKQVS